MIMTALEKELIITLVFVLDAAMQPDLDKQNEAFTKAADLLDRLGLIQRSPVTEAEELNAIMDKINNRGDEWKGDDKTQDR